ncbi:MAG: ABC transporter permease, partial [Candidatus Zixiibacteriota bacterium]
MTFRDRIDIPLGNLWRIKLRSFLTISGVTIAIAAFVTLLSFGAGNQKFISDQFDELGLFSTAYVYPARDELVEDSVATPKLDDSAVAWISTLPGVTLAYPFDDHDVIATARDTSVHTGAQALPMSAAMTRLYSRVKTGRMFESDSAREAVVTTRFLETLAIEEADS